MTEDNFNEYNLSLIAAVMGRDSAAVVASLGRGADIHHEDNFALRCAVYLGYPDMVELLLKNKANIHANGEDPLFSAVKARDNPMIEMLLTHGANPQAVINNKRRQLDK